MNGKLPISIILLVCLNCLIFPLVLADTEPIKNETINSEVKASPQPVFSKEKTRNEKFKKVLYKIPNAKKRLGFHATIVTQEVFNACEMYKKDGLTLPVIMAVIEVESNFNPMAIGKDKTGLVPESYGLMQVKIDTAKKVFNALNYEWDPKLVMHPDVNIEIGTFYLVFLHQWFVKNKLETKNDFHLSLAAYNKGVANVIKHFKAGTDPSFKYSNKVKMASQKWEKAGF